MIVRSLKINNVYESGEVNLDKHLPIAVENLNFVKSLIDNENLLGAKNMLDAIHPKELIGMEQLGTSFKNTIEKKRRQDIMFYCYKDDNTRISTTQFRSVLAVGHHEILITVHDETSYISLAFRGAQVTSGTFTISFNWDKVGFYRLSYDVLSNTGNQIGGFEIANFMITLENETDQTYTPYAMGNQELTQKLLSLESRVKALEG